MKKNVPITDITTTEVITVHSQQKLSEVREILKTNNIHHVPVVSGERLIGMVSATDLIGLSFEAFGSDERSIDAVLDSQFSIEEVMQRELTVINIADNIKKAATLLANANYHSLPVIDDEGNLRGIVTSTDLINYLLEQY